MPRWRFAIKWRYRRRMNSVALESLEAGLADVPKILGNFGCSIQGLWIQERLEDGTWEIVEEIRGME